MTEEHSTGRKIKAVVFDYGGVIELREGSSLMIISGILGVPLEDFKNIYFQHNHLSNVNNMAWEDMIIKIASFFDDSKEREEKIRSTLKNRSSRINTGLFPLFSALRRQGIRVGILSNATFALREKLRTQGIADMVDEIVISGEIGFQKPHKEAFEILFEKLHLQPGEVVFIDDTRKSLEKAHEIGYVPILFKNNEQLEDDLRKLGIEASALR